MVDGAAMRSFVAGTAAWALLFSAWLVLGGIGRWSGPAWAGGLAPLALWLFTIGCTTALRRSLPFGGARLRAMLMAAALATAAGLHGVAASGSLPAVIVAAVGWGMLLVASAGVVSALRPPAGSDTAAFAAAAAGGALAWALAADMAARPAPAIVYGVLLGSAVLATLIPRHAASRATGPDLFDCALPACSRLSWRHPRQLALAGARWTMLPMMASLALMADWCSAGGSRDPSQIVGMHLAAMLLPALLWRALRRQPPALPWIALPTALAGALYAWAPDGQAWMPAALLQSVGWGLAWAATAQCAADGPSARSAGRGWLPALVPAACVWMLGVALQAHGPSALRFALLGLACVTVAGALAATWRVGRPAAGAVP